MKTLAASGIAISPLFAGFDAMALAVAPGKHSEQADSFPSRSLEPSLG